MSNNLCFVLMPFGRKRDTAGREIDFNAVYASIIAPAVTDAGLEPLRADQETGGGIIHKPMFERLILCEYAVADLTAWNANVMYELGVRHTVRPWRTVAVYAEGTGLPFDVQMLRALHYGVNSDGSLRDPEKARGELKRLLEVARRDAADPGPDSPVFQLIEYMVRPQIDHTKTDVFRDQVRYSEDARVRLAAARDAPKDAAAAVAAVQSSLRPLPELESGVVIDLMLSYRDVKAWDRMIALIEQAPKALRQTLMVQEQYGFALNRAGQHERAKQVLEALVKDYGPRSETLGILGRVYKDLWEQAKAAKRNAESRGLLDRAISTYLRGFEADWRDAYPGINAVTLMELRNPPDERRKQLLPLVTYAARRACATNPDYWSYATLIELGILSIDQAAAEEATGHALATNPKPWMVESTVGNLSKLRQARAERGEAPLGWDQEIESELLSKP